MSIEPAARPGPGSRPKTAGARFLSSRFFFFVSIGLRRELTAGSCVPSKAFSSGAAGRGSRKPARSASRARHARTAANGGRSMPGISSQRCADGADGDVAHREGRAGDVGLRREMRVEHASAPGSLRAMLRSIGGGVALGGGPANQVLEHDRDGRNQRRELPIHPAFRERASLERRRAEAAQRRACRRGSARSCSIPRA